MQYGDGPDHGKVEAGALADILLSRWKQNLNWGMVYLNSEVKQTPLAITISTEDIVMIRTPGKGC